MRNHDYDDYNEYYDGDSKYGKLHMKNAKKKFKGKGHQSKHQHNNRFVEEDIDDNYYEEETYTYTPSPKPVVHDRTQFIQQPPKPFVPGPNTHTIKGNVIDFDRVDNIEKVEGDHNGVKTYGIKFLFSGKKGTFRVAWFNTNIRERDAVYNSEYAFWKEHKSS